MKYVKKSIDEETMARLKQATLSNNSNEVMCDFCGAKNPATVYAANAMSTGHPIFCWRWAACSRCETLVDQGKFTEIESHIADLMKQKLRHIPAKTLLCVAKTALMSFHMHAIRKNENPSSIRS